jgi:hypothetical protein
MTHSTYHQSVKTQVFALFSPSLSRFDRAACRLWRQRLTLRRRRRGGSSWEFDCAVDLLFATAIELAARSRADIDPRASAIRIGDFVFHSVMAPRANGKAN